MAFTLDEVVTSALHTLGQGASTRYPAARLLVHANNAVLRLCELVPEIFVTDEWAPTVSNVEQTFTTRKIVDVTAVRLNSDERGLLPLDIPSLAAWNPAWRSDAAAIPRQGKVIDTQRFLLYPKPSTSVQALVRHVKVPTGYTGSQTVALPRSYMPPVADYVTGMAEFADEEHVNSQRAVQLLAAFSAAVGKVAAAPPQGAPANG